ncbi:hypothetical protein BDV59DRAFT_182996 [Aspergillus ambiguus]|uniref:DNA-binding protein kinase TEL1 n=1 Tax=Aspergillus ambiguus TaxID=176160 RepID=UPI003CCD2E91
MAEITVEKALSLLSSDKQKDRSDGLADLKHILQQNKRNSKLTSLNDKACYKIFESLFRFVSAEKSLYNRAHSKGASATRLSACASVIRTAVDVFLRNLRMRSVRAIIDHITDLLVDPNHSIFDVLCVDYTKCLTSLLHHPPHREHLGPSEWTKALEFCLKSIAPQDDENTSLGSSNDQRSTLDGYLVSDRGSNPARMTPALPVRERSKGNKSAVGEAMTCIQLLTMSPNAPVHDTFDKILLRLAKFLRPYNIPGTAHQAAIRSVNSVVMRVIFDQTGFVRTFLLNLIPTIQHLWTTKLVSLKDELLVTLMLCMVILTDAVRREPSESLATAIENLTDALSAEYKRRPDKEILQIDELTFYQPTLDSGEKFAIWPRLESPRSEHNWTVVWVISNLVRLSDDITTCLSLSRGRSDESAKRPRQKSFIEDVYRDSVLASGTRRLCALQMIPFISDHTSVESRTSLIQRLTPNILDDNGMISSWTMIAMASLAGSPGVDSQSLKAPWRQVWDLASRASSSQITSRAACTLMNCILQFDLLEYSEVVDVTSSMLSSVNLSGPSTLSDSSLALWATAARVIGQINPGSVPKAANQICAWLRQSWMIGTVTDRLQTAQVATFARPLDVLNLILASTNRPFTMPKTLFRGPTGLVARGWHFFHTSRQLLNYMFDLGNLIDFVEPWFQEKALSLEPFTRQDPNDHVLLDLLKMKSEAFLHAWKSLSEDKSQNITLDTMQIFVSFCILIALYAQCLQKTFASRLQTLQENTDCLWKGLCSFLAIRGPDFSQVFLVQMGPLLSPDLYSPETKSVVKQGLSQLVLPLARSLETHRKAQQETLGSQDDETMDLDDSLMTSDDRQEEAISIVNMNREALSLFRDFATFQRSVTIQLSVFERMNDSTHNLQAETGDEALINYLTDLDEADILSARAFLPHVYRACSGFRRSSLLRVLEDLGEKCLQTYELERCENSHILCIHMMHSFVNSWATGESDDLTDSASDIYTWFTDVLLAKGRASPAVLMALVELLGGLTSCNTSYVVGQSNPSPRTGLFMILQEGDIAVKFGAGTLISNLFGQYPLTNHDAIFDDVLESLPRDPDWPEGIALRLFILAQLASRWHTLLRRSIYHMFETPAQVPSSLWYAEKCIGDVSESLGLADARELFRLFSSQVLYTWMETQRVTSMPFSIFGYTSIEEMMIDVQDEIIGQIMMRARDADGAEFADHLGTPFVELLAHSFYKAEAYSIARDLSTPPGQGSQPKGVENRMKKALGTDRFLRLIDQQFPQAISVFFEALDQYEQVERALSKRPGFSGALNTMKCILEKSSSDIILPANQQPSFRARFLLDELEFLCKRSGYELETIWTPALGSYVCRNLLESIHPALGSLHACGVIRKIRILVCVAGPVMLGDYPLEMILHALQPFLIDIYCSEDALGIFWYLLEASKDYLTENPGLMAGVAVSTLLSLGKFLASPAADKKVDSQFKSVSKKARDFLQWFQEYLETYESSVLTGGQQELFRRLVESSNRRYVGDQKGDDRTERDVLLEVFGDRISKKSLLSKPVSDHIITLLCADSMLPDDWQLDVLDDEHAISSTVAICETLQNFDTESRYRLWAARVIGRAFASTGTISDDLLREQNQDLFKYPQSAVSLEDFNFSKARIVEILCDMLQKSTPREIGLIERTLRLIVSNLDKYADFAPCRDIIPISLMKALTWAPYQCPALPLPFEASGDTPELGWQPQLSSAHWARNVARYLSQAAIGDPVVGALGNIIFAIPELAAQLLPYILHDVLLAEHHGEVQIRQEISNVFKQALCEVEDSTIPHARLVINCILYLRNQPKPKESTIVQRDEWLDIDFAEASMAANKCCLPKTALILLETHTSRVVHGSRRSSFVRYEAPPEMLHEIFKNIDDPDFFYGMQQTSSLSSVMETLERESSGFKNLLFQSAQYDSDIQRFGDGNAFGVLGALNAVNLQGIANSMFTVAGGGPKDTSSSFDSMLKAATNLRKWDIPVSPLNPSPSATIFRAFQSLNTSAILEDATSSIDECLLTTLNLVTSSSRSALSLRTAMRVLGVVTEISDVLCLRSAEEIENEWQKISSRNSWLKTTSVDEVGEILNSQEALFSSIKQRDYLKSTMNLNDFDAQLLEVKAIRQSLAITRKHGIAQASLKSAVCLSKISEQCAELGINLDAAAKFDLANVLWDQGEMAPSIQMLRQLRDHNDLHAQAVPISRAELLVTLGHHVAEARLEKPEAIIQEYLSQAVKELRKSSAGEEAGRVYHGFATFCDQQLQSPDGLEDFTRVEQLRNRKEKEVEALEDMMKSAEGRERDALRYHRTKTKQWFDLDDREYQRLLQSRESFLQQCLENYLLCLKESEEYNNDALRFCALWLDKSDSDIANKATSKYLHQVPSRKFAPLMNQLSSRLLDIPDEFQSMLFALIYRICVEHPFHGMYQIFASSKSKGSKDESALSRNRAAGRLVDGLKNDKRIGPTWVAVHNTNINYVRFAIERPSDKLKSGAKVPLNKLPTGERLERDAATQRLPPPTMHIGIRIDCDYSGIPRLVRYHPEFTIASGVSAPKIVSAWASNGQRYKQLFKGGNDDLRQDAIMEQVFEQVSSLLKDHQVTRQRNLGIRTYKVLPLTSNAGIIEFVPHTIPLHDYLMPAHQRYFPKDMKPNVCRKHIADVQTRSLDQRVRTYRQVTEHFHPVMRYFFMENFNNPDDWFGKRLSYTRSTAAISILGHVLGLGDRHGHNILLDERTGEVVHIDLGVAFEQGRVLPVPEVVPFRLTRDLVDGMGITKTEGVFRRCCEFTLEALRQESYSIMTILDVLRYDPLYSWTVSPLRMKKMQDTSEAGDGPPVLPGAVDKRQTNEPSEADRALTVVAKKLSKTLSVTATVNELIQQATDEKNLAVLYCGWAAYA